MYSYESVYTHTSNFTYVSMYVCMSVRVYIKWECMLVVIKDKTNIETEWKHKKNENVCMYVCICKHIKASDVSVL